MTIHRVTPPEARSIRSATTRQQAFAALIKAGIEPGTQLRTRSMHFIARLQPPRFQLSARAWELWQQTENKAELAAKIDEHIGGPTLVVSPVGDIVWPEGATGGMPLDTGDGYLEAPNENWNDVLDGRVEVDENGAPTRVRYSAATSSETMRQAVERMFGGRVRYTGELQVLANGGIIARLHHESLVSAPATEPEPADPVAAALFDGSAVPVATAPAAAPAVPSPAEPAPAAPALSDDDLLSV